MIEDFEEWRDEYSVWVRKIILDAERKGERPENFADLIKNLLLNMTCVQTSGRTASGRDPKEYIRTNMANLDKYRELIEKNEAFRAGECSQPFGYFPDLRRTSGKEQYVRDAIARLSLGLLLYEFYII